MKGFTPADRTWLRNRFRARPGYWFVPKLFGWGAVPVTWQGWLATLVFVGLAVLIGSTAEHRSPMWLALLVPVALVFLWLSWAKTDGGWHWHWGRNGEEK